MSGLVGVARQDDPDLRARRVLILNAPEVGVQALIERLHSPVAADRRCDLLVLLAEALAWQGRLDEARLASGDAILAAGRLHGDFDRRTLAAGVAADLALRAGSSDAVDACVAFVHAVSGEKPFHWRRYVVASVLAAIAVYQQRDCRAGSRTLGLLVNKVESSTCLSAGLIAAATAMHECCTFGGVAPDASVPLLPGLLIVPDLSTEVTTFGQAEVVQAFAGRVRLHPAAHTCELASSTRGDLS